MTTVWAINWVSAPVPAQVASPINGLSGPILGGPGMPQPKVGDVSVSIAPDPNGPALYPYDHGKAITVIGAVITGCVTNPTTQWVAEIGSGHGGDGADVFARAAGVGTQSTTIMFPEGTGVPQGCGSPMGDNYSHFDIYAAAVDPAGAVVELIILATIFYTSP